MSDRQQRRSRTGRGRRPPGEAPAQEATIAREQAVRPHGGPETGTLTEEGKRPHITLQSGTVVEAREAAAVWRQLGSLLVVDPDEFRSLLALAQDRPSDADPR